MDQSEEGRTFSVEQVWVKSEPVDPADIESTDFFHITTEDGTSIVKVEPPAPSATTSHTTEQISVEPVSIKTEITLGDYECIPTSYNIITTVPPPTEIKKPKTKMRNVKKFCCGECGAEFTLKTNFEGHLNKHKGIRPFGCDLCGKGFYRKAILIKHIRLHSGERPFACDICGLRFAQKGHIKPHKRTHTGERPYSCDQCGKSFPKSDGLKLHKRHHIDPSQRLDEKRFACHLCPKTFFRKDGLNRHKRFHSGEKPYGCDICGQRFSQSGHATQHRRKHVETRPIVKTVSSNLHINQV